MLLGKRLLLFRTSRILRMTQFRNLSAEEWKSKLTPQQFHILRMKGTERAGTGEYDSFFPTQGYFACAGCESPLYSAASKFKAGCGWPAFEDHYPNAVTRTPEPDGRVEITCANCDGHLGHVFEGERFTSTNTRHCVNSISVKYVHGEPQ